MLDRAICIRFVLAASFATAIVAPARADQGGISFWLPGAFGSLAATPVTPGWALGTIYLHSSVGAGGEVAASRAIRLGNRTTNLTVNLDARLKGDVDVGMLAPTYTFGSPVLGGQLAVSMLAIVGDSNASIDANITGALGPIGFATSRSVSDSLFSYGDLFPQATLKSKSWRSQHHDLCIDEHSGRRL